MVQEKQYVGKRRIHNTIYWFTSFDSSWAALRNFQNDDLQ